MNQFLLGFTNELIKVGAFGQQTSEPDVSQSSDVASTMKKYYGQGAKVGLKSGPMTTQPAKRNPAAPSPLTTPSHMIDVASRI